VYRKQGDPDKWLEYIVATNEWYVKPTADRGASIHDNDDNDD
jgi:hypothetical protein